MSLYRKVFSYINKGGITELIENATLSDERMLVSSAETIYDSEGHIRGLDIKLCNGGDFFISISDLTQIGTDMLYLSDSKWISVSKKNTFIFSYNYRSRANVFI